MVEPTDIEQLADRIVGRLGADLGKEIEEALRQIWNARGAADLVKLEAELSSMMGVTAAGPYVKNLDRALRMLDR